QGQETCRLERLVLGAHNVGRGKMVQVERARVVPQPQGALMYYGHRGVNRVYRRRGVASGSANSAARRSRTLATIGTPKQSRRGDKCSASQAARALLRSRPLSPVRTTAPRR